MVCDILRKQKVSDVKERRKKDECEKLKELTHECNKKEVDSTEKPENKKNGTNNTKGKIMLIYFSI